MTASSDRHVHSVYITERTVPYDAVRHALTDHYRVDTAQPFDIAMYATRNRVADRRYVHRAHRSPRVVRPRRRRFGLPELAALAVIALAIAGAYWMLRNLTYIAVA